MSRQCHSDELYVDLRSPARSAVQAGLHHIIKQRALIETIESQSTLEQINDNLARISLGCLPASWQNAPALCPVLAVCAKIRSLRIIKYLHNSLISPSTL